MSDYAQLQEELDAAYAMIEDLESQLPLATRTPHQQAAINRAKGRREMEKQSQQAREHHRRDEHEHHERARR